MTRPPFTLDRDAGLVVDRRALVASGVMDRQLRAAKTLYKRNQKQQMTPDRELLELAAKAAGIIVFPHESTGSFWIDGPRVWNPLTDDGDALRLAVKLYLWEAIRLAHRDVTAGVDIYAATRRAIVRAAAEIGRRMQHE